MSSVYSPAASRNPLAHLTREVFEDDEDFTQPTHVPHYPHPHPNPFLDPYAAGFDPYATAGFDPRFPSYGAPYGPPHAYPGTYPGAYPAPYQQIPMPTPKSSSFPQPPGSPRRESLQQMEQRHLEEMTNLNTLLNAGPEEQEQSGQPLMSLDDLKMRQQAELEGLRMEMGSSASTSMPSDGSRTKLPANVRRRHMPVFPAFTGFWSAQKTPLNLEESRLRLKLNVNRIKVMLTTRDDTWAEARANYQADNKALGELLYEQANNPYFPSRRRRQPLFPLELTD